MNGINPSVTAADTKEQHQPASDKAPQQANVRHIPIFVEGRDEPLINKNLEHSPNDTLPNSANTRQSTPLHTELPKSSSIFSRVKDIPVRKIIPDFHQATRTASPSRTPSQKDVQPGSQQKQQAGHPDAPDSAPRPPPAASQQSFDAITKIQKIQHEVLALMNRVEQYKGGSRRDKDYIYLDEMLTQNLLKLDTIDAEGKENIKAARKEAINCINKCIAVLEAKTDSCGGSSGALSNSLADSQRAEIS